MIDPVGWLEGLPKPPDWLNWLTVLGVSAGTLLIALWKFERRLLFWFDWFVIKPVSYRLRNQSVAFRILVAEIAGGEKRLNNRTLAKRIRKVSNNLITVPYPFQLDLKLSGGDFANELERAERIGRGWLARYKADLLIWGYADPDMDHVALRFVPASASATEREFSLKELLEDKFWLATAEALHLQALAALDPAGDIRTQTKDEPGSTPAERRRQLLLRAADKSARLLEDARGLTAQQRAVLAAALAEAWFTVVDETGDVRLAPRAIPQLERALMDLAGIASDTTARLHLLLARAVIGDRADGIYHYVEQDSAERATKIIDAGMTYLDGGANSPKVAEWRCWRAACLYTLGRVHEAAEECDRALESVASGVSAQPWGDLIFLRSCCLGQSEGWSRAVIDRLIQDLTQVIADLDVIGMNQSNSPKPGVAREGAHITAVRLRSARLSWMETRAARASNAAMLEDLIADTGSVLVHFDQRRWTQLANEIRLTAARANRKLGGIIVAENIEDLTERRSRARPVPPRQPDRSEYSELGGSTCYPRFLVSGSNRGG